MKTIIHVVHMRASPPQVFDALTTAEGLSQWWTTQVAVDAGTGGIIRFTFHADFHPTMQQTALDRIGGCNGPPSPGIRTGRTAPSR